MPAIAVPPPNTSARAAPDCHHPSSAIALTEQGQGDGLGLGAICTRCHVAVPTRRFAPLYERGAKRPKLTPFGIGVDYSDASVWANHAFFEMFWGKPPATWRTRRFGWVSNSGFPIITTCYLLTLPMIEALAEYGASFEELPPLVALLVEAVPPAALAQAREARAAQAQAQAQTQAPLDLRLNAAQAQAGEPAQPYRKTKRTLKRDKHERITA